MSKTYMKKEKGDGTIICVALADWASYRSDGYVFVETNEDGTTPQQQFLNQVSKAKPAPADEDAGDEVPTMANTKAEITAYLDSQNVEYETDANKAALLELIG